MNRIFAGVMLLVGMLLIALNVTKMLTVGYGAAAASIFIAAVVFGFSFIKKPETNGEEEMSGLNAFLNVFIAPSELFANLRVYPKVALPIAITVICYFAYSVAFTYVLTPERIVNDRIDKTLQMPMVQNNPEAITQIEKSRAITIEEEKNPARRAASILGIAAGRTFAATALAGLFLLLLLAFGGKANYWQILAATAWATVPESVLRWVLSLVVLFLKDPVDVHPMFGLQTGLIAENLGFLVVPSENPLLYVLLSSISLLSFYWIWLNSLALSKAGHSVSRGAGYTATIVFWILAVVLGSVMALAFPSFF